MAKIKNATGYDLENVEIRQGNRVNSTIRYLDFGDSAPFKWEAGFFWVWGEVTSMLEKCNFQASYGDEIKCEGGCFVIKRIEIIR